MPDRVMVWNEFQKREAVEMHRIPADRVVVTGAQLYDEWFERQADHETMGPSVAISDLIRRSPLILYCGSSIFIARDEVVFVREWLGEGAQASDDRMLRKANILIRPHPMHQAPFDELDVSGYKRVTVHPRSGGMPVVESSKADFFDALFHSALSSASTPAP